MAWSERLGQAATKLDKRMIHEIAQIEVKQGSEAAFEEAVRQARPLFEGSAGFQSIALNRSTEHPSRYRLVVGWGSIEDHMIGFRNSPAFTRWRELAGPHFASPPSVEHVEAVEIG